MHKRNVALVRSCIFVLANVGDKKALWTMIVAAAVLIAWSQ